MFLEVLLNLGSLRAKPVIEVYAIKSRLNLYIIYYITNLGFFLSLSKSPRTWDLGVLVNIANYFHEILNFFIMVTDQHIKAR